MGENWSASVHRTERKSVDEWASSENQSEEPHLLASPIDLLLLRAVQAEPNKTIIEHLFFCYLRVFPISSDGPTMPAS